MHRLTTAPGNDVLTLLSLNAAGVIVRNNLFALSEAYGA
jgi:hypothetical protein